mmetsp:Transcript_108673/g.325042  ORF Transcript_108673/g.325042 Transcript_108673/m.325042 type:complete len:274 (+) Transcript_108673:336-1157(+)
MLEQPGGSPAPGSLRAPERLQVLRWPVRPLEPRQPPVLRQPRRCCPRPAATTLWPQCPGLRAPPSPAPRPWSRATAGGPQRQRPYRGRSRTAPRGCPQGGHGLVRQSARSSPPPSAAVTAAWWQATQPTRLAAPAQRLATLRRRKPRHLTRQELATGSRPATPPWQPLQLLVAGGRGAPPNSNRWNHLVARSPTEGVALGLLSSPWPARQRPPPRCAHGGRRRASSRWPPCNPPPALRRQRHCARNCPQCRLRWPTRRRRPSPRSPTQAVQHP